MHSATLRLAARDAATADAVRHALQVELRDGPPGVTTKLRLEGAEVVADVVADDLSGLRAALTGLARLGGAALGALAR